MSKHRPDEEYSPLSWLIPVPFIVAAFVPLTIDHPMPAKTEQVAVAPAEGTPAASAPTVSQSHTEPYTDR